MNLTAPKGYEEARNYAINPAETEPAKARVLRDGGPKQELWTIGQLLVFLAANAPAPVELRAEAGDSRLLEVICEMSSRREVFRAAGLWWKVVRIGLIDYNDKTDLDVVLAPIMVSA